MDKSNDQSSNRLLLRKHRSKSLKIDIAGNLTKSTFSSTRGTTRRRRSHNDEKRLRKKIAQEFGLDTSDEESISSNDYSSSSTGLPVREIVRAEKKKNKNKKSRHPKSSKSRKNTKASSEEDFSNCTEVTEPYLDDSSSYMDDILGFSGMPKKIRNDVNKRSSLQRRHSDMIPRKTKKKKKKRTKTKPQKVKSCQQEEGSSSGKHHLLALLPPKQQVDANLSRRQERRARLMAKMDELSNNLSSLRGLTEDPSMSTDAIQYTSFLSITDLSGDSPKPKRRMLQRRHSEMIPDHKTTRVKRGKERAKLRRSHSDIIPKKTKKKKKKTSKKKQKEEKKSCPEVEGVSSSSSTEATEPLDSSVSSSDDFSELFSKRPTLQRSNSIMIPTVFEDECDPSDFLQDSFTSVRFSDLAELSYLPEDRQDCLDSMFYTDEELADFRHEAFLEKCGIPEFFES